MALEAKIEIIGRDSFMQSRIRRVALGKETLAIWAKLGLDYKKIKCNCACIVRGIVLCYVIY